MVPLKIHTAPQGYECYMSCAVRGDPTPHVTWYRDNVSLNTNTNYLITNTCGVCSLLILRVGPKDMGEYKIIAENPLGRAECSTNLTVRGKSLHKELASLDESYTIKHQMIAGFPKAQYKLYNCRSRTLSLDKFPKSIITFLSTMYSKTIYKSSDLVMLFSVKNCNFYETLPYKSIFFFYMYIQ